MAGVASAGIISWGTTGFTTVLQDELGATVVSSQTDGSVGAFAELFKVVGTSDIAAGPTVDAAALLAGDDLQVDFDKAGSSAPVGWQGKVVASKDVGSWVVGDAFYFRFWNVPSTDYANGAAPIAVGNWLGYSDVTEITEANVASPSIDVLIAASRGTGIEVIPEPATIGMMGIAGLGMFLARRKARS
jgi:hypothetical protein